MLRHGDKRGNGRWRIDSGGDYRMLDFAGPLAVPWLSAQPRSFMRVTLAVPKLLAVERSALAGVPALARLDRYAGPFIAEPRGFDAALLVAAGQSRDAPTAPLAALGAGFDPGDALVLRADPVTLIAGRDDVLLAGRVDDLDAADATSMIATLNHHFAADGLAFHAPRPDAWFVTTSVAAPSITTELSEVSGPIHAHLPRGEHAKAWRQWLSEIQMLLHEHPVNVAREAAGRAPVTGLWLAGSGVRTNSRAPVAATMFAAPGLSGDVARGLADAQSLPADFAGLPAVDHAIVVLPAVTDVPAMSALAAAWIDPAVRSLERRALSSLALVADGTGGAFTWQAPAPSWWQRLRARFAAPAFGVPGPGDSP